MSKDRVDWIDYAKCLACILVITGHLMQSLVKANVLPDSIGYEWFNTTIYYFHVPLFFICSGFLYQYNDKIIDCRSWFSNLVKKAIVLGLPYFFFSTVTWLLKVLFANSVNDQSTNSLLLTLFAHPVSPYWFLYILFFIFIFTPTIYYKGQGIIFFLLSLILKVMLICFNGLPIFNSYIFSQVCFYEIYFVIGMLLATSTHRPSHSSIIGITTGVAFLSLSLLVYKIPNSIIEFGMGILACFSIIMLLINCHKLRNMNWIAQYTMPIFLIHTIVAAPIRIVLTKIGINGAIFHIAVGLAASIIGPILIMKILTITHLDWLVYPNRIAKKILQKLP